MLITSTTTADQVPRAAICRAYEILEKLEGNTEIGCTWRVRNGAITRLEFYKRQYLHSRPSPNTPFVRSMYLVDLAELDNNVALAYKYQHAIDSDSDQANHYSKVSVLLEELDRTFGPHLALKLQALQEVVSQ